MQCNSTPDSLERQRKPGHKSTQSLPTKLTTRSHTLLSKGVLGERNRAAWVATVALVLGMLISEPIEALGQTTVPEPATGSVSQWRSAPADAVGSAPGAVSPAPPDSGAVAPGSNLSGGTAPGSALPPGAAPAGGGGAAVPATSAVPSSPAPPSAAPSAVSAAPAGPANPASPPPAQAPIARILPSPGTLPNEAGQIWREYDISPYTLRVPTTARPELAVVDWILRETGYEAWHTEPLGILSVTPRTLRVYHTPQMQAVVAEMVDRFVNTAFQTHTFGLRVITVDHPNWRAKSYRVLRPVRVQTPGVHAWVLPREDAALLLADLRRRSDYREHNSPYLLISNGQSTVVSALKPRSYVRDVTLRSDTLQGYEQELAQIDEGFSIELSPLLSLDGKMIDASIKCHIDMVERLVPVVIDVPTPTSPRQRVQIEVPQITHFRFHERFRWPENEVLVLGLGVVPIPLAPEGQGILGSLPLKLPGQSSSRGELIVIVESRGKSGEAAPSTPTATRPTYQGRY